MQIKNAISGDVLFDAESSSIKDLVVSAVQLDTDISSAYLHGAYLHGADLRGATYNGGVPITREPLQFIVADYFVLILDEHMKIGCELHSLSDWFSFDDRRFIKMDGKKALTFWLLWKETLWQMCAATGRITDQNKGDQK